MRPGVHRRGGRLAGASRNAAIVPLVAFLCGVLAGCSSSPRGSGVFDVPVGAYTKAFDATRDVLREKRLALDRVDARAGVVSTSLDWSGGLLTPWDGLQQGLDQEWEDAANMQYRAVRVSFEDPSDGSGNALTDDRAISGRVEVVVYRRHRAGRRLESESFSGRSFTLDPALEARHGGDYLVPIARDERLESLLASEIARRIESGTAPTPSGGE